MSSFEAFERATHLEIVFADPSSSNALSLQASRELAALVRRYRHSWRKPVVVRARGRVFCSGGNLSDYKKLKTKAEGLKVNREITKHLNTFTTWPVLKLAVIEGDVFGGGMEWLARFEARWSLPSVYLAFWQRRIGLSFGWGGGRAWAALIGEAKVRRLLMEARLIGAPEALRLGLVDRLVGEAGLDEEIARFCQTLPSVSAGDTSEVSSWSVIREARLFSSLWLGPVHRAVLQKWKK